MMTSSLLPSRRLWIMMILSISLLFMPLTSITTNKSINASAQSPYPPAGAPSQQLDVYDAWDHYADALYAWGQCRIPNLAFMTPEDCGPPPKPPVGVPTQSYTNPLCGESKVTTTGGLTIEKPCKPVDNGECPPNHAKEKDGLCWRERPPKCAPGEVIIRGTDGKFSCAKDAYWDAFCWNEVRNTFPDVGAKPLGIGVEWKGTAELYTAFHALCMEKVSRGDFSGIDRFNPLGR